MLFSRQLLRSSTKTARVFALRPSALRPLAHAARRALPSLATNFRSYSSKMQDTNMSDTAPSGTAQIVDGNLMAASVVSPRRSRSV